MANSTTRTYPVHPAANLFPMMTREELLRLKEDIRVNGQREAVVLWREQVLDGRNRLRVCEELGIEPNLCELLEETEPVAFVLSANLHRRQLRTSQRSLIAARLATLSIGANQHDGKEGGKFLPPSIADAAKLLSVSTQTVKAAKTVLSSKLDKLVELVERDAVSVHLAAKFAKLKLPAKKRDFILNAGGDSTIETHIRRAINDDELQRRLPSPPRPPAQPKPEGPPPVPVCPECGGDEVDDVDGSHCAECSAEMVDANDPPATIPISHTTVETADAVVFVPGERIEPERQFSSDPSGPDFNLAVALNELEELVLAFLDGWPDSLLVDAANYLHFLGRKVLPRQEGQG